MRVLVLGGPARSGEGVRGPLVQRHDLGTHALALEHGAPANSYNGSAIDSVPIADVS